MNVRCWNCGNDQEVTDTAIRAEERARVVATLEREARIAGTCGDIYRHNALMQAIRLIEHP